MSTTLDLRSGFAVLTGLESLKLRVVEHLRLVRGSWFYLPSAGTPYDDLIFGIRDPDLVSQVVLDEVRKVDEVDDAEAVSVEFDVETRRVELAVRVISRYGEFTLEEGIG